MTSDIWHDGAVAITAIGNRKGGVGKTTVCLGLASELARMGRRVLVIDMDMQANATMTLGGGGDYNIRDVLLGEPERVPLNDAIVASRWDGIDIVAGTDTIVSLDQSQQAAFAAFRLRKALDESGARERYDDILIDTPPATTTATISALIAADQVLAVVAPEPWGTAGLSEFLKVVDGVAEMRSTVLPLYGVLINGVKGNSKEHQYRINEMKAQLGDPSLVLAPEIDHRVAAAEMPSEGAPLYTFKSSGAKVLSYQFAEHARMLAERSRDLARIGGA